MASGWTPLESLFLHVDSTTAGFPVSPCDTRIILHARAVVRTQRIVLLLFVYRSLPYGVAVRQE